MKLLIRKPPRIATALALAVILLVSGVFIYLGSNRDALALSKSDWKAGMIISDSLFYDNTQMSASQIQNWLNNQLTCDTNGSKPSEYGDGTDYDGNGTITRAEWAKATKGYTGKFVCLTDYYENTSNGASNLTTGVKPSGSISAASMIKLAADTYKINPKVLLVKIKKESLYLTTDEWPWPSQFEWALGYGCPDPPPGQPVVCDPNYKSFYQQVKWAARGLRNYVTYADSFRYKAGQNNTIQYNPDTRCESSTVYIENHATAGLYNYTPYQPNSATINWKLGSGEAVSSSYPGCGAFGNINFLIYYNEWFGSTRTSYDAEVKETTLYSDSARSVPLPISSGAYQVNPGQKLYGTVKIKNLGSKNLDKSFTRLGTTSPTDRASEFYNSTWLTGGRVAQLSETSIAPTDQGTFLISLTAPRDLGAFTENFGIVAEGKTWMDRDPISIKFNITPNKAYDVNLSNLDIFYDPEMKAKALAPYVLRPDQKLYVKAKYKNIGSATLTGSLLKIAPTNPRDHTDSPYFDDTWSNAGRVVSVVESSILSGSTATFAFALHAPNTPGSYSDHFGAVVETIAWIDTSIITVGVVVNPNAPLLQYNESLRPGQSLATSNGYQLIFQTDGNLVIYKNSRALWSTRTNGRPADRVTLQSDGNLVMYSTDGKPLWASRTHGKGLSRLQLQSDGNLVLYKNGAGFSWASWTNK